MNRLIKLTLCLFTIRIWTSCGEGNDDQNLMIPVTILVKDFTVTIDENPNDGAVLGDQLMLLPVTVLAYSLALQSSL